MPAAKLSKGEWNEIRMASEAGASDGQLSQDFGVSRDSIRMKRMREDWLTPAKVQAEIAAQRERELVLKRGNPVAMREAKLEEEKKNGVTHVTGTDSVASQMLKDAEKCSALAMKLFLGKLKSAADSPESIDGLSSVQDVAVAVKGARQIAGLDKPQLAVGVNFGAFWDGPESADEKPVVVVQSTEG